LDDLEFRIAGRDLKHYGSRGEHKTALIALKLSEAEYMKAKTGTAPIILLDDLPSELRPQIFLRLGAIVHHLGNAVARRRDSKPQPI
jgi:recombinational DNA repair ATPase RecF